MAYNEDLIKEQQLKAMTDSPTPQEGQGGLWPEGGTQTAVGSGGKIWKHWATAGPTFEEPTQYQEMPFSKKEEKARRLAQFAAAALGALLTKYHVPAIPFNEDLYLKQQEMIVQGAWEWAAAMEAARPA